MDQEQQTKDRESDDFKLEEQKRDESKLEEQKRDESNKNPTEK
jgi:hypothetical protein